jgi:DNA-binding NtrC family response regulator
LINALERAQIMGDGKCIRLGDLPHEISHAPPSAAVPRGPAAAGDRLAEIQRSHIVEILQREQGNKARAAKALGVNRRSLYRLLDKYNIQPAPDGASEAGAESVSADG